MKKWTIRLGLCAVAVGAFTVCAMAGPAEVNQVDVTISFPTASPIYYVESLPSPGTNVTYFDTTYENVYTDGSGKISGVAGLQVVLTDDNDNDAIMFVNATVTGSLQTKSDGVHAIMNLKGSGYSFDPDESARGAASISLNFDGLVKNAPQPSGVEALTPSYIAIGKFTGSITPKLSTFNKGKAISLKSSSNAYGAVQNVGAVPLDVSGLINQVDSKLTASGNMCDGAYACSGTGSINTKKETFSMTVKGVADGKGAQLKLTGGVTVESNGYLPDNVTASGKIAGQKVQAANGQGSLN